MSTTTTTQTSESKIIVKGEQDKAEYKYARFLPHYAPGPKQAPLTPYDHVDPGLAALSDPTPESFLEGATVNHLSPRFGVEVVDGVDLTALDTRERAQLALYVAKHGVVVFRNNQKFIDADPRWQIDDWGAHWGRIHQHPVSGPPKEFPELHIVHYELSGKKEEDRNGGSYKNKLNSTIIHTDIAYEANPAGLTTLFLYSTPVSGGDTLYLDTVEAYKRLSPSFRAYLETLTAVNSGFRQAEVARQFRGEDAIRRNPVEHEHPVVRRHPVTGEKALYVQPGFTTRIVGLRHEESDAILKLLFNHLATGHDFQVRARWGVPGTVVLWDNRVTCHSALVDFDGVGFRHGARVTAQAERPFI
ncbi:hypothetical protein MNV49_007672 [Pseudohyphozyma bogoriensis]|nr:hypothetical protein MNV49_007672 [Pseudohyphozyma bogoriensis]